MTVTREQAIEWAKAMGLHTFFRFEKQWVNLPARNHFTESIQLDALLPLLQKAFDAGYERGESQALLSEKELKEMFEDVHVEAEANRVLGL